VPGSAGKRVKGPRWGRGKRWLARWSEPDGTERSKACALKDEALSEIPRVDVEVRGGTYVRRSTVSFQEYAEQWLSHQLHQRLGTARSASDKLRLHAFPAIGRKPLGSVTRTDIQELVAGADSLVAPSSKRLLYVYVRAVFAAAVEDRLIPVSPCRKIRLPQVLEVRVSPLTVAQVRARAERCPGHLRGMVWFGAGTGLRPGELRGLTVDRVEGDLVRVDRQLVEGTSASRVVFGPLKTDASDRVVRLAPWTLKRLIEHMESFPPGPEGLVFTSARRTPLRRAQLAYAWDVATAGLEGVPERSGWHELRHHHASLLIAAGMSPRAVADRLGHADPSETLRTYSHLWPSDEARIVDAIEGAHGPGC